MFGYGGGWVRDKIASGANLDTSFHVLAERTVVPASVDGSKRSQIGVRTYGPGRCLEQKDG